MLPKERVNLLSDHILDLFDVGIKVTLSTAFHGQQVLLPENVQAPFPPFDLTSEGTKIFNGFNLEANFSNEAVNFSGTSSYN